MPAINASRLTKSSCIARMPNSKSRAAASEGDMTAYDQRRSRVPGSAGIVHWRQDHVESESMSRCKLTDHGQPNRPALLDLDTDVLA